MGPVGRMQTAARPIRSRPLPAPPHPPAPRAGGKRPRPARPIRRYHFYTPGLIYIAVTLFIALGAINSQNNLLFAALGLAVGGLLISGFISGGALMGLRAARSVPGGARLALGEPLVLVYRLSNISRTLPACGLHIHELPRDAQLRLAPDWPSFFAPAQAFLTHIAPRSHAEARITVLPRRRGRLTLGPLRIWTTFPFGLVKKSITFPLGQSVLIHPPVLPLRPGLLRRLSARAHSGAGTENAPGPGEEFFGLREYTPGDSPRRIAWKRSARTGDLVVRQHASPAPQRLWIVLVLLAPDAPDAPRLNERAIALAASFLRAASDMGMAVGLAIPGDASYAPHQGRAHADRLLEALALLDAAELPPARPFPEAALSRSACVIVSAADPDPLYGPRSAARFGAADAERTLAETPEAIRILALLDSVPPASPPPRRFSVFFRSSAGDEVGAAGRPR